MARANQFVVELLKETGGYAVAPTWTSPHQLSVVSIDAAAAEPPAIEDPDIQVEDAAHQQIVGLVAGAAQALTCKAGSFGTVPSAGSAPSACAESELCSTVFGATPTSTKVSTEEAGATSTSIVEDDDDAHNHSSIQIVGVELPDGTYEPAS